MCFHSYTLLFGVASKVALPAKEHMMPVEVAVDNLWIPAVAEYDQALPSWWRWSRQQMAWYHVDDMQWGHVKMKKVDPKRMLGGLHQVVFWCGTAQQGYGATAKAKEKWFEQAHAPQRTQDGEVGVATGGPQWR